MRKPHRLVTGFEAECEKRIVSIGSVTRPGREETQRLENVELGQPDPALLAPLDAE